MSQAPSAAPAQKEKSNLARILGAIAALLALAAIALIALGAIGLANVSTPNMRGFNPGATVTTTDRGMSVYARSDSDRASTVCTADDGSAITLARPSSEFSVDVSGSDFYEVARTPDDLAAGQYALTCQGTEQALYVGPAAPNTSASGLMGPASLVGGVVLGFFALTLMIIAIVMGRSRNGQQAAASSAAAAHPYQSYPPAGYPSTSPGSYRQGSQHDQRSAFGSQERSQQVDAPPPPPGWGSTSSEPTQAIAYGQGQYGDGPAEQDRGQGGGPDGDGTTGRSGEQMPPEEQGNPQDRESVADPPQGAEPADGSEHPNGEDGATDQPYRYPPPPPPQ